MTLVGRAVSSESGETYAACDVFHACVTDMAVDSYAYVHIYVQIFTVSIYGQAHLYRSTCIITGWGSKRAATARLLPYMGGTLTYTKVMDTSICIILFYTATPTYIFYA